MRDRQRRTAVDPCCGALLRREQDPGRDRRDPQLTRWKVGRLLAQAKDKGFIRIEIVHPRARRLPLERTLRERFGLTDAVVVPTAGIDGADELHARAAQAAADYLAACARFPRTLGISWGRTLHDVADHLAEGWATGVNVVQINGGVSLNQRAGTAAATAVEIASKATGQATLLPSPAILERLETKQSIEADRTVAGVLEHGRERLRLPVQRRRRRTRLRSRRQRLPHGGGCRRLVRRVPSETSSAATSTQRA